ncbi:hypothetical protein FisN_15Lh330 [Fistulifera solaris]|uniref:Uncharacterized protein n=1 Tax=Fistulifera solaris TaxID=1519565 RepID=A0A1Z5JWH8_FISSO|nr:hypothetical protein FisN_15Lh330 [Fistulifera solaris]|eukprot:GAX18377.1 hypothetical protein FisN_15Lh330 [Fistulifera solaris]
MKPLQPSPHATTTANANIPKKKTTVFPSLLRKTKTTPHQRLLSSHKKPPVAAIAYDENNNHDQHSRISELTHERMLPACVETATGEQDMSSLSQASVQYKYYKAKRLRRQQKVQDFKDNMSHHKIMDLQKVQPQIMAPSALLSDSTNNEPPKESTVPPDRPVLPTIFSATTPQSQKEVTPVADNRTVVDVPEVESNHIERDVPQEPTTEMVREENTVEEEKEVNVVENENQSVELPKLPKEEEEGEEEEEEGEEGNNHHNNKFDKVKALLHRINPMDRVKALQKSVIAPPTTEEEHSSTDAKKTTLLQVLEENKPSILLLSREKAVPKAIIPPTHKPEEPPETLPQRSLAEPHPEMDGIVSLVELDGPRPPNAPTPVHKIRRPSVRRTSFEPPDSEDEHHVDAPTSRDAPDEGADGDVEDIAGEEDDSQTFFHGMMMQSQPDVARPQVSMRKRLFERNFQSMAKEQCPETKIFSSLAKEIKATKPAVDTAAMMAALNSVLPPKSQRAERKKKGSSPYRSAFADSPRRRQQKFAQKASQKAEKLQQSRKQHPVTSKKSASPGSVKPERSPSRDPNDGPALSPTVSSSHELTATPSLPRNIVFSDSLISDLDQSVRNFPMRQVIARPDVEGLSSLEWTKHNSDSEEDDLTADRYAITEDRYIPMSPDAFSRPISPRSPVPPPMRLNQSYTNPEKIGDALADSITEWSVDNTARTGDTAEVALEVVLNSCNQTPFGQICIRDTKEFQSKDCFTPNHSTGRDRPGVRFAEEDNLVNKLFGMIASSGYDRAHDKTPLTSNRHFFGETEEDQTQDTAPSKESRLSNSEEQMHPMRCYTNVPTGPATPRITRSADVSSKHGRNREPVDEADDKLDDASGRYTCKSSKIGIDKSDVCGDDSDDEDNTHDRYFVSKSAKINISDGNISTVSSTSEKQLDRISSHSSGGSHARKNFSFDNDVTGKDEQLARNGSSDRDDDDDDDDDKSADCQSSTASPLRPEESDMRAQRDDASFRSKIIHRLGLDDESLGIDSSVNLFSKVSSLQEESESFDLSKYMNDQGDQIRKKIQVSIDCSIEETPSLKQRLLSFGKQVIAMTSEKQMEVHEKINKLKPSAKGVLIRSIDRANPDIIDLTNIENSDDLEDMEAVWLFDLSPKQAGAVHSILTFANDENNENLVDVKMVDKYQPMEEDQIKGEVDVVDGTLVDDDVLPEGKIVVGKSFSPKEEIRDTVNTSLQATEDQNIQIKSVVQEDKNKKKEDAISSIKEDCSKDITKPKTKPGILFSLFEQAELLVCGGNAFMLEKGEDEEDTFGQSYLTHQTEPPSLIFATINSPSSTFSTEYKEKIVLSKATESKDELSNALDTKELIPSIATKESVAFNPEDSSPTPPTLAADPSDHDASLAEVGNPKLTAVIPENKAQVNPIAESTEIPEQVAVFTKKNELVVANDRKDLLDAIFEQTETLLCGDDKLPKVIEIRDKMHEDTCLPFSLELKSVNDADEGSSSVVIDLTGVQEVHMPALASPASPVNSEIDGEQAVFKQQSSESLASENAQTNKGDAAFRTIPLCESSEHVAPASGMKNQGNSSSERDDAVDIVLSHGQSMEIDFDEDSLPDSVLQQILFKGPVNSKVVQPPRPEELIDGLRYKQQTSLQAGVGAMYNKPFSEKKAREAPRPESCLPLNKKFETVDQKSKGPRPETFLMKKQINSSNIINTTSTTSGLSVQEVKRDTEHGVDIHDASKMEQSPKEIDKIDFVTSITCALFTTGHGWISGAEKSLENANARVEQTMLTDAENGTQASNYSETAEELTNPSFVSAIEENEIDQTNEHNSLSSQSFCAEKERIAETLENEEEMESTDNRKSLQPGDSVLSAIKCGSFDADVQPATPEELIVATVEDCRVDLSSSQQHLDSSWEESLQLITEGHLPTNSYEKSHSASSSAEECSVEREEYPSLSPSKSSSLSDSRIHNENPMKSISADTVESKVETLEILDPIIGPNSTVSVSTSSVPIISHDVSSAEVIIDVSTSPKVGQTSKGEKGLPTKFTFNTSTPSNASEKSIVEVLDELSPRLESQSSSFSLEAAGAEVNTPFKLPVIEEGRIEDDFQTEQGQGNEESLMRILSSGTFERGLERLYLEKYHSSVVLGVAVQSICENLIIVQGEEVVTGTIPTVEEADELLPATAAVAETNERIEVSDKPVVTSHAMESRLLDDEGPLLGSNQIEMEKQVEPMVCDSQSDAVGPDINESRTADEPLTTLVTAEAVSHYGLTDIDPLGFFPCLSPAHDNNAVDIMPKDMDGIDPCGTLGITTRQKKDASPTFAGTQQRSASAPRPRTSPILEQKPQMYTSSLMKKLQQRKLKRDEIRSNSSFTRRPASFSGTLSMTSTATSNCASESFESTDKASASHKSSDPPSTQKDKEDSNDYQLMEIVSEDDSSTEADGSSLLLALTRSEGEEPLLTSPRSPSLASNPSPPSRGEAVKESASEKTEPVRNTAMAKAEGDAIESTYYEESQASRNEKNATQSASLRKTLDRIRANSSKSTNGDASITSSDTDPVDIDYLFSRFDNIVKNMVILDDQKLPQPIVNKDVAIIDVTDQRSEQSSTSGGSFLSELPKRLASTGKDHLHFSRDLERGVRYQSENVIDESDEDVNPVTSFGSETTTPSQKARSLRYQLDQALKASAAIRNSQERLGMELHTFKNRLQLQRRELSPVRDQQSFSGYSHPSSVTSASRIHERRPAASTNRRYYHRDQEYDSAHEELLDRIENDRAKTLSPRSAQGQTYALADDDDDDDDMEEDEDDLFDFDESSEDELEIDSAASSNEVKFQQLQSILKGLRENEERKVHPRPYY